MDKKKQKYLFFYFLIFALLIILIMAYFFINNTWNFRQRIKDMENYYKSLSENSSSITPEINTHDPVKGSLNATVTIFEYSDFSCPACQSIQNDLKQLEQEYQQKIKFVYKGLPLTSNPYNIQVLEAAYCAGEQNKFWEYKNLIYNSEKLTSRESLNNLASQLSLNQDSFNTCLEESRYLPVLEKNRADALSLQISSIPTIFVNEVKFEGFINFKTIRNIIDNKLSNF